MILDRRRYGKDNYAYLLAVGADAALVDPGDPIVALGMAAAHGVHPRWILHTHGHPDHTGGSARLRERTGARVLGHGADAAWFAPDEDLAGRRELVLGALRVRVHEVPGHTPGSVLLEAEGRLLTGDTLFWGGCGNCRNGGDPRRLARSFLGVVAALPGALEVNPGHDYGLANLPFALDLEPGNAAARTRLDSLRMSHGGGTEPAPSTLADERASNPFLRVREPALRAEVTRRAGLAAAASDEDVFVALRALRDRG
ncbi:MAG TPA: hydroxyacylglutathione hydrolase C-terminal domain-containing protein [Anaeromyxobacter sp.]